MDTSKKRSPKKHPTDLGSKDIYNQFKKDKKELVEKYDITRGKFSSICKELNEMFFKEVLKNNPWKLPLNLGVIEIRKFKLKPRLTEDGELDKKTVVLDYKKTNDLWERDPEAKRKKKLIFRDNKHTNGFIHKFIWNRSRRRVTNIYHYKFIMRRDVKRELGKILQDENNTTDYFELK